MHPVPDAAVRKIGVMAGPGVFVEVRDQAGLEGVVVDVADKAREILFLINQNSLVAPAEKLAVMPVPTVEALSVHAADVAHDAVDVALRRAQEQMVMIGHQREGGDLRLEHVRDVSQQIDKCLVVRGIQKDILPPAATVHDVIPGAGVLDA